MTVPVIMVVAMARRRVIGVRNGLPWRMRSDLKHFKATTMGKPMIMGRKTYESIGRPLPGRRTVVITRDQGFRPEGVDIAASLEDALVRAQILAGQMPADSIIIAGGATIYAQALPLADRIIVTELALDAEGDTFFPDIDHSQWQEVARTSHPRGEKDDAAFDVVTFDRRSR